MPSSGPLKVSVVFVPEHNIHLTLTNGVTCPIAAEKIFEVDWGSDDWKAGWQGEWLYGWPDINHAVAQEAAKRHIDVHTIDETIAVLKHDFLFVHPSKHIARMREWNRRYSLGISAEAFTRAEKTIPVWPEERLVTAVLVPYLSNHGHGQTFVSGVRRTVRELWKRITSEECEQPRNWFDDAGASSLHDGKGSGELSLLEGNEHPVGLRWEVIDMGSRRGVTSYHSHPSVEPHAGILAAAALNPHWVKSMDGETVPYVSMLGYKVSSPLSRSNTHHYYIPRLERRFYDHKMRLWLDCVGPDTIGSAWRAAQFSMPAFVPIP